MGWRWWICTMQQARTGSLSSPRRWGNRNKEDTPPTRVEAKGAEDGPRS
jgi:hypothetical protein